MKKRCIVTSALILLTAFGAHAIDRDARLIHSVSFVMSELDDIDSVGVTLLAEDRLEAEQWAILFMLAFDQISPDIAEEIDALTAGVGLKFYPIPLTSVSGLASYTTEDQHNNGGRKDRKAVKVDAKLRLAPATAPVSPFARASLEWRDRSSFSDVASEGTFSEILITIGGGVEFTMNDDLSFVFEAGLVEADDSKDNSEDLDGWIGAITMQYYWQD
jgi:hypothetical protein